MGSLKDLQNTEMNKHLVLSKSGKADIYIHDTLKDTYKANADSIYEIQSRSNVNEMIELSTVQPYLADKWIFEIDWRKCRGAIKQNKWVLESDSSCFCFKVSTYKDYKEAKEFLDVCNDLYLSSIRKSDTYFLLDPFEVSEKIKNFVAVSYSKDVDKIFEFRELLQLGNEVNSTKDVVKLLGANSSSVASYAMSLLNDPPTTERGFKMVYSRRVAIGIDLCNAYGKAQNFRNFLNSAVYSLLLIKILYMQGTIYNKIENLPEIYDEKTKSNVFDETKLKRYSMYIERVTTEIPYARILRLYTMLQSEENKFWGSTRNLLEFLYNYYGGMSCNGTIGELQFREE